MSTIPILEDPLETLLLLTDRTSAVERNKFDNYVFGDADFDGSIATKYNSIEDNIKEIHSNYLRAVDWQQRYGDERDDLWVVIRQRLEKLHTDYNSVVGPLNVRASVARLALGPEAPGLIRDSYVMWLLHAAHYYTELMKIKYLASDLRKFEMEQYQHHDSEVAKARMREREDLRLARELQVQAHVDEINWRNLGFTSLEAYHEFYAADAASARELLAKRSADGVSGKRKSKSKKRRVRKTLRQRRSRRQTRNIRRRKHIPYRKIRSRKTKN